MKKDGKFRRELPGSRWYPGDMSWDGLLRLTGFIDRYLDALTQRDMPSLGQITHTFQTRSVSP